MKELKSPIFYHPDECDCVECLARRDVGGLDHDPSNDDAEFEKHEEEVMKRQKFKIDQVIKFSYLNVISGKFVELTGTVIGHGQDIRKRWPREAGECPDNYLLVRHYDVYENVYHHIVDPMDVIEEAK